MREVINLDACTIDELKTFEWECREKCQSHETDEDDEEIYYTLARYCHNKQRAIEARNRGDIQFALKCEEKCERFYNSLPDENKW